MTWGLLLGGLGLALFGAGAYAAVLVTSRAALAEAVSRRLRGGTESLGWIREVERDLSAASVTTSLAMVVLGAALTGLVAGASVVQFAIFLLLGVVPVTLFSGFMLPRWLTPPRAERVAALAGPVLRVWGRVLGVLLPTGLPADPTDLRHLWQGGAPAGVAADQELVTIGGVMAFAQRRVRSVMTPRTEIVAAADSATLDEIRIIFRESGYTRLPVYRGTLDEIIGMVHAFDLFKLQAGDPLPIRPVAMAPEGRSCADLLLDMQRERRHLAIVIDEFGGTLGLATLEDLLEAMVGEIFDEDEPAPSEPGRGTLREVDGSIAVTEIEEQFEVALPAGHATTLAGRLVERLGRIPTPGERFLISGLEVDIVQATPARVERLVVRRGSPPTTVLAAGSG